VVIKKREHYTINEIHSELRHVTIARYHVLGVGYIFGWWWCII